MCVAVFLLWSYFFAPKAVSKPKDGAGARPVAPAVPGAAPAVPGAGPAAPAAPPVPAGPPPVQQATNQQWVVTPPAGEFSRVEFTSRGAAIVGVTLRNAYELAAGDVPKDRERYRLDPIVPVDPDLLTGMVSLDEADSERLRTLDWTVAEKGGLRTVFTFVTRSGFRLTKTYVVPTEASRFDFDVSLEVERAAGTVAKDELASIRLLGAAGFSREPNNHTGMDTPTQPTIWIKGQQSEPLYEPYAIARTELEGSVRKTRAFRLCGMKSHFFLTCVFADEDVLRAPLVRAVWVDGGDARFRNRQAAYDRLESYYKAQGRLVANDPVLDARIDDAALNFHRAWVEFDLGLKGSGAAIGERATFHVFCGPLARNVLAEDRYAGPLSELITYPFAPDFLARLLLWIFDLFNGWTASAGLAVICMTLVVRGGMMPLSIRNQLSMRRHGRKVAILKPRLEVLKVKWAKDPRRFREEQVKLFKANGVGFPMGCLMILLQMPIFFSLFSSLRVEYDIRQQAFAWIRDLSGPDRLMDFARNVSPLPFPPGGLWGLNVLPFLYMGLSIWQQRLMPKPQDEQQAQQMKMAKWMSIIFPVLLYNYTAALAIYMCVSSVIAIIEGRIVRAKDAHDQRVAAEVVSPGDGD